VIGCIYRPPASDINTFIDALDSTLDIISKEHKLCLLHGDFNLNILHADYTATHDFLNTLYSVNFYPLITKPTRVTTHSASLIDNILFNSCDYKVSSGLLWCDVSDHLPVFQMIHSVFGTCITNNVHVKYRNFTLKNIGIFKLAISSIIWDEVMLLQDAIKAYDLFLTLFNYALESSLPLIAVKSKVARDKPWFTGELRKLSRKKNRLYRKSVTKPTPHNLETYKKYRNQFTSLIKAT